MKKRCKQIMLLLGVTVICAALLLLPKETNRDTYVLPVLLYHHFADTVTADTVVSPQRFREQMEALCDAGYVTVTLRQIEEFVDQGIPLPEKSVLITIDDGYTSNLTIAAPILQELGMCATVFVIGIYEGESINPHSRNPLYPVRFSYQEAMEWVESGVLDLQCHTFDMHQLAGDGFSGRDGILRLQGEDTASYCEALRMDMREFARRRDKHGVPTRLVALAYPYGYVAGEATLPLQSEGIRFTFTVAQHTNVLRMGDETCLWNMGRFNVTERDRGKVLVRRLES